MINDYIKTNWQNDPSTNTPLSAANLNHMEEGIAQNNTDIKTLDGKITLITSDYESLDNKPQINNVVLVGNKTSNDLNIQGKLTAGANITIENDVISSTDSYDDSELRNEISAQDRRIGLLEEAALGKLYTQETTTSYSNDVNVPSGALSLATLDMLGGMSRKCKNLLNPTLETTTLNGVTCTNNGDGTYTTNGTATALTFFYLCRNVNFPSGTYKMIGRPTNIDANSVRVDVRHDNGSVTDIMDGGNGTLNNTTLYSVIIRINNGYTCNNVVIKPMLTTNTSLTYNDFEPYTPNLIDGKVDDVVIYGKNKETHKPIPSSVLSLPNYGIGVNNNVYNYLEYVDGKVLYHERVGVVDLSTITFSYRNVGAKGGYIYSTQAIPYQIRVNAFISDNYDYYGDTSGGISDATNNLAIGQFSQHSGDRYVYVNSSTQTPPKGKLYYPLETEIITDVTDLFPLNFNELEVEANGHISFHYDNDYKVDVPSTISYLIDLKGALNG